MTTISLSLKHGRRPDWRREGSAEAAARAEAFALALTTAMLRRLLPSLRPVVPRPHDVLGWQLRRIALRAAREQEQARHRRIVAAAVATVAVGAVLSGARAAASRHQAD